MEEANQRRSSVWTRRDAVAATQDIMTRQSCTQVLGTSPSLFIMDKIEPSRHTDIYKTGIPFWLWWPRARDDDDDVETSSQIWGRMALIFLEKATNIVGIRS